MGMWAETRPPPAITLGSRCSMTMPMGCVTRVRRRASTPRTGGRGWSHLNNLSHGLFDTLTWSPLLGLLISGNPSWSLTQGLRDALPDAFPSTPKNAFYIYGSITAGLAGGGSGGAAIGGAKAAEVASTGTRAIKAVETADWANVRRTLADALRPDKLDHVFVPKHNLGPLVETYGSEASAMEQIVRSLNGADLPRSGLFEVTTRVGGQGVVVRGSIVDGVVRIGTAFTP